MTPPVTPPRPPLERAPPVLDPAIDAHLQLSGTFGGYPSYGERSRVGVIDSGVDSRLMSNFGTLFGAHRVADPAAMDTSVPDRLGHGTQVARIILGFNVSGHPGGVAQRAGLASFRYLADDGAAVQNVKADGTFAAGAQWLADAGVNVVNVSTDALRWDSEAGRNELYDGFARLAGRDALIVVAAGDAKDFEPSQLATLPLTGSDPDGVRDHWLVVGAVSSELPNLLSSTSNACGAAKDVCLMATGDVKTVDPNATGPVAAHGTDFAAAQVSGAVAVVRDRFTYLGAEQARQILLGTATDLGAPGVDDVYGHGRIDLEKALNGPGRLDWGQMDFDFSGIVSSGFGGNWANDMSGEGGLTLHGNRPLLMFLSGNNTYTGPTLVHGTYGMTVGILGQQSSDVIVRDASWVTLGDGALLKADLRAEPGTGGVTMGTPASSGWPGVLGGDIRIGGNLSNASSLRLPDRDIAVHVGGDYLQTDTGLLSMYLGGKPMDIAGTARLDGRLRIVGTVGGYVFNARADVLTASQVEGTFDAVDWTAPSYLLSATPHYEPQGVWLELTRNSVTATASRLGLSPSAVQGAQRLESAFGQLDATTASADPSFLSAAAALQAIDSGAQLERSLASLSGEFHAMDAAFVRMTVDDARHSLESRMDEAGAGDAPRVWSRAFEQQRAGAGADLQATGWTMGANVLRANGATMGLSMTTSDGHRWHGSRNDREHVRLFEGQWYANWEFGGGRYLLGSVGFGQGQRTLRREIDLDTQRFRVDSDLREQHATFGLQAGARMAWSATSLVPYAGLQAIRLQRDAFREEGAAGFGLAAPASDTSAAMGLVGARLSHRVPWAGGEWILQGRMEWQSLLSQSGGMQARFTGLDAWTPLDGAGWDDRMGLFDLGLYRDLRGARFRLTYGLRSAADERWSTAMLEWERAF
ncbi:autotransporter domain-containing protein [Lysobacter arvi]|uniref:S8 family serine peptidase n=1 Tax=Lysobacter arvi TaxID=3038776 RepID=A0ABU1CG74_9GAMM|nr:S8 family serine peptidase [Lysobacter arvi]MDR0183948.1 S8 family serine peptidase [Lysobacter arvi]